MNRTRLVGIVVLAASVVGLGVALPSMAGRLAERDNHLVFFGEPISEPAFAWQGDPIELATVDEPAAEGRPASRVLEIRWRDAVHRVPIVEGMREDDRLPGLLRHDDWLSVLGFAEGARTEVDIAAGVRDGVIKPRLIVAMRFLPEGFDPGSWGKVRRADWVYRFVEFVRPQDGPEPFRIVEGTYREINKLGDPAFRRETGREADYWQFAAMQQVTPPTLFRSRNRDVSEAMESMGWTWPAAWVSVLGFIVGAGLTAVGSLRRRTE